MLYLCLRTSVIKKVLSPFISVNVVLIQINQTSSLIGMKDITVYTPSHPMFPVDINRDNQQNKTKTVVSWLEKLPVCFVVCFCLKKAINKR